MNYELLASTILGLATLATITKVAETKEEGKTQRQRLRSEATIICAKEGIAIDQCPSHLATLEF